MADEFSIANPRSRELFERAREVMPAGISHDSRRLEPFPLYIERAAGSRKWTADGQELIDYVLGHAALVLGHSHPAIVEALRSQASVVTHPGGCHRLEVEWAEAICRLVPSAERVRFVMSGTEATMLAMRVARAVTGRDVIVRIQGHFHGWHDYATGDPDLDFDTAASAGVPKRVSETVRVARLNDIEDLERALAPGDVAAVILEPEGARSGTIPPPDGYLEQLREATTRAGTLLVFDEVVSGFRASPGGVQQLAGVTPDMTALAKAVAGGLPGGALCGRADVMEIMAWPAGRARVLHQGTWNGNPLAAAAGIAALELLADGAVQRRLTAMAERLRAGLNGVIGRSGVGGFAFGGHSAFRIMLGDDLPHSLDPLELVATLTPARLLKGMQPSVAWDVQRALLLEGIDIMRGDHGWLSTAHDEAEVDTTVAAFERAVARLVDSGTLTARTAPVEASR